MCSLLNIQLSSIYSLRSNSKDNNSSVFDVSEQVLLVEKPTDPNNYKPLNELDLECISIEDDAVSISSDESCCDIIEVSAWDPKNHDNTSSALTDKCGVSNKPKLYVPHTISSPLSKLEKSTLCVKTTAKVDCVNTHPVSTEEAALSPLNMAKRVLDVSQTLSTSTSLQNNAMETFINFQQHKLPRMKTNSIVDPKKTGIEISSRNSDLQRKSSSSVGDSGAPSNSQTKHEPLEIVGCKLSQKNFCCAPSWLASIYGGQIKCSCTFVAGSSSSIRQPVVEGESCKDNVTLLKNLNNGNSTVKKGTTSTPEFQLRLPLRTHRSNYNSKNVQKTQANLKRESSELRRRQSQVSELSKEENSYSKLKQESNLTSVLELKVSGKHNKSKDDLLEDQEKAHHCDIWLYKGKERKSTLMDSDIISTTSNESYSDIMEAQVSNPRSVRKDLLRQCISQGVTPSLPVSGLENGTSCTEANMNKAHNKNLSKAGDLTPKQPGTLTTESTIRAKHSYSVCNQDTGLEPSKMSCQYIDKVRDVLSTDSQATKFSNEVVQGNQIEYNTLHLENKSGSNDNKCLTKSEDGGLQGFYDIIPEVREEHSLTSVIEDGNTKQQSQILPTGDQEYERSLTDQLSEIITQFPSGAIDKNTVMYSKATAEINEEHYSKEVIDKYFHNFEDLVKRFDGDYNSVLCIDRHNPVLHSAMPTGNPSHDKIAEKMENDTSSKKFCCLLSWSASIVGEQCKCSCTFGPNAVNSGGDEISQQFGNKFAVIKETKTSTVKKGTRSADQPSKPQMKTQGNICDQPMQEGSINSGGKCEPASGLNNSLVYSKIEANKGSRKRKTQPADSLQFQEGIAKSSSSEMVDNTQDLVQCSSSLPYVSNTAVENKQKTSVKKKKGLDKFPKKARQTLMKDVRLGEQAKILSTVNQMGRATGQCRWASQNNPKGKQDCNNQLSRKNKPNEHHQSKSQIVVRPKSLKNTSRRAMDDFDKTSTVKKLGKKQLKDCKQHKSKTTGNKMQRTRPSNPEPESLKEDIQTFTSPDLHVNRKQAYKDNSQLYPKKVEQSPQIRLRRNMFVNKGGKNKDVSKKKKISSTHTRDSGLNLQSKMALYKDGSFSLKNDNVRSSLSKPDNKATGQMAKKTLPLHPENPHALTNVTRPKRLKESFVPEHKSTGLVEAKSNSAHKENISEQTSLSKEALEKDSFSIAKVKDPLMCNINKSDREMCTQDIQNLDIHSQEVQKNQAMKSPQNTQVTPKKSVNFDTRVTFYDLETTTGYQLRKLDADQELAKDNYTLENKVNEKTTTVIVKLNSEDFNLLSKVRKSAQEAYQEIIPKPHSTVVGTQNISSVETTEAPQPSVYKLKTSSMSDRIKVRCQQDKKNKDLTTSKGKKDQVVKTRGTRLDLQRQTTSPIVHPSTQRSNHKYCAEITPVMQENKRNDESEKCLWKLENKHCHEGKNQTPGQRKRKANNPGSERGSSKRKKSENLNQETSCVEKKQTCTKESNQDLEQTSQCQFGHIGGDTLAPKSDSSVVGEKASSSHLESQKTSFLENKTNLHPKKRRTKVNITRDKATCSDGKQNCVPSDKMKASSSKKVGIGEGTKTVNNSQEHLEKVASTSDTGVKSPETLNSGSPIGQSPPKAKIRECILRLFRLPLPLEKLAK